MIHAKKEGIGHQVSGVRNDARFDGILPPRLHTHSLRMMQKSSCSARFDSSGCLN